MKMKSYNLPAVLLAVITAMVLMLTAGVVTAYADEDSGYTVEVKTMFDQAYIALPGQSVALTADVYYDFDGEQYRDDGDLDFKWELDEEDVQFAKLKVHKYDSSIATLKFKPLPEGQPELDAIVRATVTVYSDGEEVAQGSALIFESTDYYVTYPTHFESYLRIGATETVEAQVRHYTMDHTAGEIVKNVNFSWETDGADIKIDEVAKTEETTQFNVTRLSGEDTLLILCARWNEGNEAMEDFSVLWTEEVPTDLNEYKVSLPADIDNWDCFVDEGQVIERQYLEDNTSVAYEYKDGKVYLEKGKDYNFVVEKYQGYDEETGLPIWKEYEGDLKTDPKGSEPDLNGEPTEGTGIYRIYAKAIEGTELTGITEDYAQWIFMYSNRSISSYAPNFEFDYAYGDYLDEEPWFRYSVPFGTELDPTLTLNEQELEEGTDYEVVYLGVSNDYYGNEFPEDAGYYVVYAKGINEYYGTSYERYIKIGKANLEFSASAKTIKAKASKKMTFAKSKCFKVSGNQGDVTFEKVSGDKKITVSKAGKVTVKKGLKKGKTYKVKVKVTDGESEEYFAASQTVTLKVKVTK